jgi:tetratricopeptide (TPR) repeat protein
MLIRRSTACLPALLTAVFTVSWAISFMAAPPSHAKRGFDKATAEPADQNFHEGIEHIKKRDYEGAIDNFQQAVYFSRNHYNPEAYKYLGLCYKACRNYPKAIEALNNCLSQTTEHAPDVRIDKAECLLNIGDVEKARAEIDKSYAELDGQGTARQKYAQGEVWEKLGDYGQAMDFYSSAIDEKPNYTDAWMARGRMQVLTERYNDALKNYRDMLEKGPMLHGVNMEELYYNMGTCLYKRGDHQGAIDHYLMALDNNPDSFDSHLALGHVFDEERHISSAIKEYQAALRTMPKTYDATKINSRLIFLQSKLQQKEAPPVIKPSPQMRQEYDDSVKRQQGPPPKDSGF